ncbi:MAG: RDD family protein [Bdellovibrionaceae bacterium]|nr:RDD family protein [Pseudobdellovibrionaceae bacterium]
MVYPDPDFEESKAHSPLPRLAPVMDRLLAFLIDFLIFSPVIGLAISGLLKEIRTLLLLNPESPEAGVLWILLVIAVVALAIFSEALCLSLMGGSPGQRFLHLRVRSLPDQGPIDFVQALSRAALWWLSLPWVMPLLSVYTHPLRRAFHDRASDTLVVTDRGVGDLGPLPLEREFFLSWSRMFLILVLFGATLSVLRLQDLISQRHFTQQAMSEAGELCLEVPAELAGVRRLDRVVATFLAGGADKECLDHEADLMLWSAGSAGKAFAYLAKGLAADESDVSTVYLNKACEVESKGEACALARFASSTEESRSSLLRAQGLSTLTSRVLLLRENVDRGELASAAALIRDLRAEKGFEDYLSREEVRTVWKIRESKRQGRTPASSELDEVQRDFEERYELQ